MDLTIFGRIFRLLSEQRQVEKLAGYIDKYVFHTPIFDCALLLLVAVFILQIKSFRKNDEQKQKIHRLQFYLYLAAILILFFFCRDNEQRVFKPLSSDWYLVPFGYHESQVLTSMCYFFFFIPFGYLLRTSQVIKSKVLCIILIPLFAVSIEVLQYVTSYGDAAIHDIIAYSLGMLVGFLVYIRRKKVF